MLSKPITRLYLPVSEAINLSYTKFVVLDWTFRDTTLMKRMIENIQVSKVLLPLMKTYLIPLAKKTSMKFTLL